MACPRSPRWKSIVEIGVVVQAPVERHSRACLCGKFYWSDPVEDIISGMPSIIVNVLPSRGRTVHVNPVGRAAFDASFTGHRFSSVVSGVLAVAD